MGGCGVINPAAGVLILTESHDLAENWPKHSTTKSYCFFFDSYHLQLLIIS